MDVSPQEAREASRGTGFLALRVVSRHFNTTLLAPDLVAGALRHRRLARSLALQRQCVADASKRNAGCVACAAKETLLRRQQRMLVSLTQHEDAGVRRAAMRELEAEVASGVASANGIGRLLLWARKSFCTRRRSADAPST